MKVEYKGENSHIFLRTQEPIPKPNRASSNGTDSTNGSANNRR